MAALGGRTQEVLTKLTPCSLRCRTAGSGAGVPGLAMRPGPSGYQSLRHLGTAGFCRRADNKVEAHRLDLYPRAKEKREKFRGKEIQEANFLR